jgi:hypothetical protein
VTSIGRAEIRPHTENSPTGGTQPDICDHHEAPR